LEKAQVRGDGGRSLRFYVLVLGARMGREPLE